jgi:hypothetical protein
MKSAKRFNCSNLVGRKLGTILRVVFLIVGSSFQLAGEMIILLAFDDLLQSLTPRLLSLEK